MLKTPTRVERRRNLLYLYLYLHLYLYSYLCLYCRTPSHRARDASFKCRCTSISVRLTVLETPARAERRRNILAAIEEGRPDEEAARLKKLSKPPEQRAVQEATAVYLKAGGIREV